MGTSHSFPSVFHLLSMSSLSLSYFGQAISHTVHGQDLHIQQWDHLTATVDKLHPVDTFLLKLHILGDMFNGFCFQTSEFGNWVQD